MAAEQMTEAGAAPSRRHNLGGHALLAAILLGGCVLAWLLGQLDTARRASDARSQITAELAAVRARLEGQIAFNALLDRFPGIELAGEARWRLDRMNARSLERLPVRLRRTV